MSLSSWLCTNSSKNMFVKIIHPGGHAELHDGPILAAQLMLRNPRCCVAHPHVFQQPWAIVSPDTILELGHKYYVVPISTIRKLQRVSLKSSPNTIHEMQSNVTPNREDKKSDEENNGNSGSNFAESTIGKDGKKEGCFSKDNCFASFFMVTKMKENGDDLKEEAKSSSSSSISSSQMETKPLTRKGNKDSTRGWAKGSPKRFATLDHWQPSLESIHEE